MNRFQEYLRNLMMQNVEQKLGVANQELNALLDEVKCNRVGISCGSFRLTFGLLASVS